MPRRTLEEQLHEHEESRCHVIPQGCGGLHVHHSWHVHASRCHGKQPNVRIVGPLSLTYLRVALRFVSLVKGYYCYGDILTPQITFVLPSYVQVR